MREICTFILRLMVDSDEPDALRGILHLVANNEEHAFTDGQSLLAVLQQVRQAAGNASAASDHRQETPEGKSSSIEQESKS